MIDYSVIIPAFNGQGCIARALTSVFAQTVLPKEVIVIDDGSKDDTVGVVRSFSRVTLLRHERSMGPSAARNTGIFAASRPWIAFLDCDDAWAPNKMEEQARVLRRNPRIGLVYAGIEERIEGAAGAGRRWRAEVFATHHALQRMLLLRNCITGSGSAVVARRDLVVEAGGFDTSFRVSEDWDLWIRLAFRTEFGAADGPWVTLYKRVDSNGSAPDRMFEGEGRVLEKSARYFRNFLDAPLLRRKAEAERHLRRANSHLWRKEWADAKTYYQRAILHWPATQRAFVPWVKLSLGIMS